MKPILSNTDMVRAILEGLKTVTRRVVRPQPKLYGLFETHWDWRGIKWPYKPGDLLYVRETFKRFSGVLYGRERGAYIPLDDFDGYQYKADGTCFVTKGINPFCDVFDDQKEDVEFDKKWHPSIHMPKEAARIFLRVTDVRVERLQDISTYGAYQEGVPKCKIDPTCVGTCDDCMQENSPLRKFQRIWNSTIKPTDRALYGWAANPWVWVIEFARCEKSEVSP